MKNHHTYPRVHIGESDIATLIMAGMRPESEGSDGNDWLKTQPLHFGGDGAYSAYIVDESCEIPDYYSLVATFEYWFTIYDDRHMTFRVRAKETRVYRARERGAIIQIIGRKPTDLE